MMMLKFAANQSYSKTKYEGGHEQLTDKGARDMMGAELGIFRQEFVCCCNVAV